MSICQDWDALHWYQKGGCTFAWKFLEEELWRWWHDKTLQCCRNWGKKLCFLFAGQRAVGLTVSLQRISIWNSLQKCSQEIDLMWFSARSSRRVHGTRGILFWCCFMASLLRWPMCGPYCFGGVFSAEQTCQQSSYDIMLCIVNVLAHPTCGVQDSLLKFT